MNYPFADHASRALRPSLFACALSILGIGLGLSACAVDTEPPGASPANEPASAGDESVATTSQALTLARNPKWTRCSNGLVPSSYMLPTKDGSCRDRRARGPSIFGTRLSRWDGARVPGSNDVCLYTWHSSLRAVEWDDVDDLVAVAEPPDQGKWAPVYSVCSVKTCESDSACAGKVLGSGRMTSWPAILGGGELLARCPKCGLVEDKKLFAVLPYEDIVDRSVTAMISLAPNETYLVSFDPKGSQVVSIDLTAPGLPERLAEARDGLSAVFF